MRRARSGRSRPQSPVRLWQRSSDQPPPRTSAALSRGIRSGTPDTLLLHGLRGFGLGLARSTKTYGLLHTPEIDSVCHEDRQGCIGKNVASCPAEDHLAQPALGIGALDQQVAAE